ncbi:MAG: tRNA (N6-threonylcarbamoyladenosine(37)-N6)-methyltransferase TrmO [Chloroflexi bacterium]|nr:tRNA (N6-threonylcarbamoyladenosine(37)-N6)-methyltransferase TrmO [Chloroflexota bacterium]MCC6891418.1 tRNA (N6-threonylcarbamoyladenosine(37)-N6)-methyltransferase TrmO [Anaerolineae bacterium]
MTETQFTVYAIGVVRSALVDLISAPLQGDEGTFEAWLELRAIVTPAAMGINVGDELVVLTWLHLGKRDVLQVHPRSNPNNPLTGVFATRSPDRPNPIGLHMVTVLEVQPDRLRVAPIEAVDGTPIIDIKPILKGVNER